MCPELRRVSVSLRRRGGPGAHFLADHPVEYHDGLAEPIDYAGRSYSYSHTNPGGGYDAATRREVYVFVEDPPSEAPPTLQPRRPQRCASPRRAPQRRLFAVADGVEGAVHGDVALGERERRCVGVVRISGEADLCPFAVEDRV